MNIDNKLVMTPELAACLDWIAEDTKVGQGMSHEIKGYAINSALFEYLIKSVPEEVRHGMSPEDFRQKILLEWLHFVAP